MNKFVALTNITGYSAKPVKKSQKRRSKWTKWESLHQKLGTKRNRWSKNYRKCLYISASASRKTNSIRRSLKKSLQMFFPSLAKRTLTPMLMSSPKCSVILYLMVVLTEDGSNRIHTMWRLCSLEGMRANWRLSTTRTFRKARTSQWKSLLYSMSPIKSWQEYVSQNSISKIPSPTSLLWSISGYQRNQIQF